MIGMQAIGTYIPPQRISNYEIINDFNITTEFLENKIGVVQRAIKEPTEDTSDMCVKAFNSLTRHITINPDDIDCLIVCTQNPDGYGLPHTSSLVHEKLSCRPSCAAFDIGLGCSGYVYSLSVATSFMNANNMSTGLLFTADPYSKIISPKDRNTVFLFGDAATITLLTNNPIYSLLRASFGTVSTHHDALIRRNDQLYMNGRAIFDFAMKTIPADVRNIVASSGLSFDDIDLFIFHQGSKYIVDMLARRLGLSESKVALDLAEYGNTVSSSIPIILEKTMHRTDCRNLLISGFGVGLSYGTAILQRI
jgi:3-oxoacyl-[acyl-carrier-protein] synthase III